MFKFEDLKAGLVEDFKINIEELKGFIENKIKECDRVIIVPHINADFDAIGSALGLSLIAKKYNKPFNIIVNDPPHIIEPGVKKIINECNKEYLIEKKDKYLKTKDDNEKVLYLLTDVNKKNLICVNELLTDPDNVIVIDHHNPGYDKEHPEKSTVEVNNIFIDNVKSSASEIVTELLKSMEIEIPSNVANYLYSGIYLDTFKLTKNYQDNTMTMAALLLSSGATAEKVNEYFREDIESDRKVQALVSNIKITNYMIAIVKAMEDEEYTREELAKAADYALKYGVDASFAIGRIEDDYVSVSGRSNAKINMDAVMKSIGGGGSPTSGAARRQNVTIEEMYNDLIDTLKPSYAKDDKNKVK